MRMQSDADRREALSRTMRRSSQTGRRGGAVAGLKGSGKVLFSCLILMILLCGGLVLWNYAERKVPFYILVGDESLEHGDEEGQGGSEGSRQGNLTDKMQNREGQIQRPYEVPETVRVLLMNSDFSDIYHDRLVMRGSGSEITITAAMLRETFDQIKEQLSREGFSLENGQDCYVLVPQDGGRSEILSIDRACGRPSYRGKLYLYVRGDQLVLINELLLEEYLYSVLPSEMPASYQGEALKAQAVCARTYACAVMENPRYAEFDAQLDDSTSCQVYGNLAEHENTTNAVDETRGEILLFGERPVSTYYYSTSCGIGSDIGVWQGFPVEEYPYLTNRGQNAAHETLQLADDTEFAAYLTAEHGDMESGYPWYRWNCQVSGVDADVIYEKLKERYCVKRESVELVGAQADPTALSSDVLLPDRASSEMLSPDLLPHPGRILSMSIAERNLSGCAVCLLIEGENASYRIYGEYNVRYLLCDGKTSVTRQDGSTTVMSTILPSAYLILTPLLDKDELIGYSIIGGGYGHGVGMSQNGADTLAASGMGYREILDYYYIGTKLKTRE